MIILRLVAKYKSNRYLYKNKLAFNLGPESKLSQLEQGYNCCLLSSLFTMLIIIILTFPYLTDSSSFRKPCAVINPHPLFAYSTESINLISTHTTHEQENKHCSYLCHGPSSGPWSWWAFQSFQVQIGSQRTSVFPSGGINKYIMETHWNWIVGRSLQIVVHQWT